MFRLIWIASIHTRGFLRRWMPTNVLLDKIRTRSGLKYGVPAMLLAIPYLYAAAVCRELIEAGGPGWLNLFVLITIWSALKMLWIGPVSLVMLAKARWHEHAVRRNARRISEQSPGLVQAPVMTGGVS